MVGLHDGDNEDLDRLTRQLRHDIRELDVERADLVSGGAPPEGTKSLDWTMIGAIAVTVWPVVLPKVLEFLQAWAMRHQGQAVKIKIQTKDGASVEVEAPATMSAADLDAWISAASTSLSVKKQSEK